MAPCDKVVKRPLACESNGSFEMFKIITSNFIPSACTYDFFTRLTKGYVILTMVTEGVVHDVPKVVTWSSFSVIGCHK